jgi:hypothetical protein
MPKKLRSIGSLLSRWRRARSSVTECGRRRESEHGTGPRIVRRSSADRQPSSPNRRGERRWNTARAGAKPYPSCAAEWKPGRMWPPCRCRAGRDAHQLAVAEPPTDGGDPPLWVKNRRRASWLAAIGAPLRPAAVAGGHRFGLGPGADIERPLPHGCASGVASSLSCGGTVPKSHYFNGGSADISTR